jgi:hypothetical protein
MIQSPVCIFYMLKKHVVLLKIELGKFLKPNFVKILCLKETNVLLNDKCTEVIFPFYLTSIGYA